MLEETHIGDGVVFAGRGDLVVMGWRSAATRSRGEWAMGVLQRYLAQVQGDVVLVLLVLPTSTPPDAATRAYAATSFGPIEPRCRRLISVPLGNDLWAILVRMVMRGMLIMGWTGWRTRSAVASDVEGALREVGTTRSQQTPTNEAARALLEHVVQLMAPSKAQPISA